ncbi:hypothetical protein [Sorangium sp. So ce233]|uniref:hypothetical protein n=1 Tax=Sorangium sp. So ce233 TaxID=3133290 RepID=UPI003F628CF6
MNDDIAKRANDVRDKLLSASSALLDQATAGKWNPDGIEKLVRSAVMAFEAATARPVTIDPPPDGGRALRRPLGDPPPDHG